MFESQAILKDQAQLLEATIVKLIQKYTPTSTCMDFWEHDQILNAC